MKRKFTSHRPLFTPPLSKERGKPKTKWRILPTLWRGFKRLATIIGMIMILNAVLMLLVLPLLLKGDVAPPLPDEMVLYLEFKDGFIDLPQRSAFSDPFKPEAMSVRRIVDSLDAAAADDRVKGIVARMRGGNFGLTHVHEVRAALKRFRATGKFAHIYSSSYGEGAGGIGRYYLASAFDEIWMQPLGIVTISGVSAHIPFMRGTLDKIGVKPQFFQRKDYKTAYESLTRKTISKYNKEMMKRLIGDIRTEMLATLPQERGIDTKRFERLVDKGLFTAKEAVKAGLITKADYGDVLLDNVAEAVTGERDPDALNFIKFDHYAARTESQKEGGFVSAHKPKVALVYAVGAIMPDDNGGIGGGQVAAASVIAPAILAASKDEDVRAIILRVDSPGGSPTASESILRAVERARERGKPVIVSMGSAAASGGYWISAYADRIFALPTTLTGSIGVVGGKFSVAELSKKLGINWEEVSWGKNAGMWSFDTPFDESEAERINAMMDQVYDSFLARVSKGRGMSEQDVDKIAGGRVWTGRRALEVGLVDEIGGLDKALDYIAGTLGHEGRTALEIVVMPKPKTTFEQIIEFLEGQVAMGQFIQWQSKAIAIFQPALQALAVQTDQPVSVYETLRLD